MTGARHVAVIDIGKTNAKLAVVDPTTWREVDVRTMPNRVLPGPPYPHFDIDGIWRFLLTSLGELNALYPVGAISITTHGASAVLLDAAGEPALPMLDYEHDGPDTLADAYDAARPPFAETGSPRLPLGLNLGAQLFWQERAFPEEFGRVSSILTYPQYWAFKLTGVPATEMTSLGCHTDLWNPWRRSLSGMVEERGWASLLAPVRKAGDMLGTVRPDLATMTGLTATTPVFCGIHDSNASLYPHLLARNAPFSVVSSGTWVICMAVGGAATEQDPARDTLVNVNAFGDPVPSARFMGGREFDLLTGGAAVEASPGEVSRVIEGSIMHFPAVENRSGPFQGRVAGWSVDETGLSPGERFAAVSYYLALMTAECLALTGADGLSLVEGPFARNRHYLEMLAAATRRDVIASGASATGTSIGAAMLVAERPPAQTEPECDRDQSADRRLTDYAERWRKRVSGDART